MFYVFGIWWCLSALGRTDFSPSSDEQMPPTDITQDMRVPAFLTSGLPLYCAVPYQPLFFKEIKFRCRLNLTGSLHGSAVLLEMNIDQKGFPVLHHL